MPSRLRQFLVDSPVGQQDVDVEHMTAKDYYSVTLFYPIMDRLINEMERRFDDVSPVLQGIEACDPSAEKFLDVDTLKPLINAYELDKNHRLVSQIDVSKTILAASSKKPDTIPDLLLLLRPVAGFPDLRRLLQLALTMLQMLLQNDHFRV